jgi:D-amino-acid oxidase
MSIGRRSFLKNLALAIPASYSGLYLGRGTNQNTAEASTALLALPDFSEKNLLRSVAGLRPLRTNGIRLEAESVFGKQVIHNYGHGGAGFTMSWGSAMEVSEISPHLPQPLKRLQLSAPG